MFSLFGKRKPAETPTEEAIQGPADGPKQSNGDDFIFVERKPDSDSITSPSSGMMYPPMPQSSYGPMPYPPPLGPRTATGQPGPNPNAPISYLQDIPFELSPQLATKDRFNGTQMQVDGILALMTRQLSVDAMAEEYTFALERSVQNDSY
ncbi:collagen alpha-1(XXVI) chain [Drosophila hydei]|uniref:Collagen alpha-1(XXVI) chain n=1 Tax=Drosophila hydei TaxID=7224 RepID=A0A6J1MAZ9_DROHY|nr:collagen alpha-1(XXVI) chain [Drosophila hydei]